MRLRKSKFEKPLEGDLTPMIDMTFQLIAFFMVLVNFSQAETNNEIQLPSSELAKPAKVELKHPIYIHVTKGGKAIIAGNQAPVEEIGPLLQNERNTLDYMNATVGEATVIIRGHHTAEVRFIQKTIELCQKAGFEKFALRAKEDFGN